MATPGAGTPPATTPLAKVRAAVGQGLDRYRALGAVPEARRLLGAAAGSYVGDRLNTIALIALSYELGDGALGVGGMLALTALPRLVLQGPAGALVDRFPGHRLVVGVHLVMAVVAGAFALLAAVDSLWLLYGLTLALSALRTVAVPAFEVQLMAAVPAAQRGTANAVHTLTITAGEIVGPLLGSLVFVLVGGVPLFLLNALSFVVIAAAIPARRASAAAATSAAAPGADASGGYLALVRRGDVAVFLGLSVALYTLLMATMALLVVRAVELGLGEGGVGIFYAVIGAGSLVGGLAAGAGSYSGPRAVLLVAGSAAAGAVGLALFGVAGGLPLAAVGLVAYGLTGDLEEIAALTYFQGRLPERLYGRFFSLYLMAGGAGGLVGALLGPALAAGIGTERALPLLAVPALVLATLIGLRAAGARVEVPAMPAFEPEVVGHGLFGVPSQSDLLPDAAPGGPSLAPRLSRLI